MTEDDLMKELENEILSIEILQPEDVTLKRLAKSTGRKSTMIEKILNGKVQAGELRVTKKFDPESCRNVNVYQRPD